MLYFGKPLLYFVNTSLQVLMNLFNLKGTIFVIDNYIVTIRLHCSDYVI